MSEQTTGVVFEIATERERQVDVHGWDPDHDDLHDDADWAWLVARRAVLMCNRDAAKVQDCRRLFVEIAAISVAAIESIDRRPLPVRPNGS